ncbi:MAG: VOC family protein [bacterium]|nr:VOC family protein [bacterium]
MFKSKGPFSGFAVKDISKAKDFYLNTLGLDVTSEAMGILRIHLANGADIVVYPKADHEPATYTMLNFPVTDINSAMNALESKGVTFEHYDLPGLKTDENGISRSKGMSVAWFKDPSGNILSVIEEQ